MQAVLLCELFARFRGRKAVVRPSKQFEYLYSRVSDSESLLSSNLAADQFSYVPPVTHSASSSSSSSISFASVLPSGSLPAWSPQTDGSSTFSPSHGLSQYDHSDHINLPVFGSPVSSFSPHQFSSSHDSTTYDSQLRAFPNVSMNNNNFPFYTLNHHGQLYSNSFSSQILDHTPGVYDQALPSNAATYSHQVPLAMDLAKENQWHAWVEAEGKKRLLAACFIIDNHAAMLHESSRARSDIDPTSIPLTGHHDALWSANSADEWFAILQNDPAAGRVQLMPSLDSLTPEQVAQYGIFDTCVILNAAALNLPRRNAQRNSIGKDGDVESSFLDDLRTPTTTSYAARALKGIKPDDRLCQLFSLVNAITPNVYVALHHTPLHDLLAVSGESWVFSQKVLGSLTYVEHQKRLKAWIEGRSSTSSSTSPVSPTAAGLEGMSSSKATVHAARALVGYFERGVEASNGVTPYVTSISNYWSMYVCVLIIWAFGQKSGKFSSSGSSGSPTSTTGRGQVMGEDEAVAWLRAIADSSMPETVGRAKGRREASAVIVSMVKRRLEADCVGGRSCLYNDAVGILKNLEESVSRRWF